ncbi:MAG TPA: UxaA family hydrolase, partial [Prolixibacteraceae bacterium]|nr:UxaA family hydrolase [Prolixibacteraceae bacterium]
SGCQLALFTTGRGTPFGSFIPTVKISTNSELASRKKNWIDFDAGTLLSGAGSQAVLKKFVEYIVSVANGEKVNHEKNGFKEIAIFKSGVTL